MRVVEIMVKDKGWTYNVAELLNRTDGKYDELIDHRVFESLDEAQSMFLQLNRSTSRYALEHAHVCPADLKYAISKIESLPKYR